MVKINVCVSAVEKDEDNFILKEFLEHNHTAAGISSDEGDWLKRGFKQRGGSPVFFPNIVTYSFFGHCMKASLSPHNQLVFDFTSGISDYLLISEAGARTNWHQDFTGTSVFYILAKGQKHLFVAEPTEENQNFLRNDLRPVSKSKWDYWFKVKWSGAFAWVINILKNRYQFKSNFQVFPSIFRMLENHQWSVAFSFES